MGTHRTINARKNETEHRLRNLHDAIEMRLAGSRLKDRFSVGFNPETSRCVISFERLSQSEFNDISNVSSRLGLDSTQWDIGGNLKERRRTVRIAGLTTTHARDFARAVAARFQN
jgi:hypothetical protein